MAKTEQLTINFNLKGLSDLFRVKRTVVGRVPVYNSPDELRLEMIKYFDEYADPTFAGLVLFLGFCSFSDFYEYKNEDFRYKKLIHGFIEQIPSPYRDYIYVKIFKKLNPNQSFTPLDRKIKQSIYSQLRHVAAGVAKGKIKRDGKFFFERFGYHQSDLVRHLESKFHSGMNWDNYGIDGWHIDHIKPTSWFDWTEPEKTIKECWALSNLQPLWATINCAKGNRYEG